MHRRVQTNGQTPLSSTHFASRKERAGICVENDDALPDRLTAEPLVPFSTVHLTPIQRSSPFMPSSSRRVIRHDS
jgi:hypothetical protein